MAVRETTAVLSFHIAPSTTVPLTYKRAAGAAVDKDRDDRRYRSRGPRRMPVDGPDDARAGTAENRNEPAIR